MFAHYFIYRLMNHFVLLVQYGMEKAEYYMVFHNVQQAIISLSEVGYVCMCVRLIVSASKLDRLKSSEWILIKFCKVVDWGPVYNVLNSVTYTLRSSMYWFIDLQHLMIYPTLYWCVFMKECESSQSSFHKFLGNATFFSDFQHLKEVQTFSFNWQNC